MRFGANSIDPQHMMELARERTYIQQLQEGAIGLLPLYDHLDGD